MIIIHKMMRYDTEKSEVVLRNAKHPEYNYDQESKYDGYTLYRTNRGSWFLYNETRNDFILLLLVIDRLEEPLVNQLTRYLESFGKYEIIEKYFGGKVKDA